MRGGLFYTVQYICVPVLCMCQILLNSGFYVSLRCRCLCLNDTERWTAQQLLDHSFLKPSSPKHLSQYQDNSPEGDSDTNGNTDDKKCTEIVI